VLENLRELFRFRALVHALVVRHLSMRYRGSVLGFFWSLLNPLCLMAVYTIVFRYYIRFNEVENYTIFLFCGLLPWIWSSSALVEGASSIVSSGHLITKSMFPAHILPAVSTLTTMVNFLLSIPILLLFMIGAGAEFHWTLLAVPVLVLLHLMMLQGLGLALGSLNVMYRDVQHLVANVITLLFFLCPIVYPATIIPEKFRVSVLLNPFALLTVSYQDLILAGKLPSTDHLIVLVSFALSAWIFGNLVFNRNRETFSELL
jgi:lipopolysaccharide transport system permease protein